MSRPRTRFVPVKSAEQQSLLMLTGTRDALIRRRTQLSNMIRSYAAEFGLVSPRGLDKIEPLLSRIADDGAVPMLAKELFSDARRRLCPAAVKARGNRSKLLSWHRQNEQSRRLAQIPGVGPIGAALMTMKVPDPASFRSGRDFAAWLGLTPKDHSTAGKQRLGGITRAGDEALRSVLVVGATARSDRCALGRGQPSAMADGAAQTQAAEARRRGAGQQDRADRVEADGQWRKL